MAGQVVSAEYSNTHDGTRAQYGGSVGYQAQNGLGAVVAYENKREADPNSDVSNMAVGLSYSTPGGFYAAVTRGRTDFQRNWQVFSLKENCVYSMRRVDYWESVVSYSREKMAFGVGYSRQSMRENAHLHWVDEYIFAAEYYLMPKAKIYAEQDGRSGQPLRRGSAVLLLIQSASRPNGQLHDTLQVLPCNARQMHLTAMDGGNDENAGAIFGHGI
ncbi:porin [Oceanimonas smirnovii]|uniref:porin n=1 Tax=Oceanimonas smirnovii TaxID=264574 RepID=UPI0037700F51